VLNDFFPWIVSALRRNLPWSLIVLAAVVTTLNACAQGFPSSPTANGETATPKPGVGHDYLKMFNETVNPTNGQISIRIQPPQAKGRGVWFPFLWKYESAGYYHLGETPEGVVDFQPSFGGCVNAGWSTPVPCASWSEMAWAPPISGTSVSQWEGPPPTQNIPAACNIASGFTFTDPSGSTHNLTLGITMKAFNYGGNGPCLAGMVAAPPTGQYADDGEVRATFTNTGTITENNGIFSAPQGSSLADVGEWPLGSNTGPGGWTTGGGSVGPFTVTDKDGTTYSFDGNGTAPNGLSPGAYVDYPGSIKDRNGNIVATFGSNLGNGVTVSGGSPTTVTAGGIEYVESQDSSNLATINYTVIATAPSATGSIDVYCPQSTYVIGDPTGAHPLKVPGWSKIELPNGTGYTFYYGNYNPTDSSVENNYGLLNEIIYPNGAWVKYTWSMNAAYSQIGWFGGLQTIAGESSPSFTGGVCAVEYSPPQVATRQVSFNGSTAAQSQSFVYSTQWQDFAWTTKSTTVTTTDKVLNRTSKIVYNYLPGVETGGVAMSSGSIAASIPLENTIQYYDWGAGTASGSLLKTVTKTWLNAIAMGSEKTTLASGQTSETILSYGLSSSSCSNAAFQAFTPVTVCEADDYDYGAGSVGSLIRKRIANYTGWFGTNLVPPQVSSIIEENAAGTTIAQTNFLYDGYALATTTTSPSGSSVALTGMANHDDANYGSTMTTRANLTSIDKKCLTTGTTGCASDAVTLFTYDITGQPASMVDGNNHKTLYSFLDQFSDSTPSTPTNGYLTEVTLPATTPQHYLKYKYRYSDGQLSGSIDENSQTTSYFYSDPLARLTETLYPDGGESFIEYNDGVYSSGGTIPNVITSQKLNTATSNPANPLYGGSGTWKSSETMFDGLGHALKSESFDPNNASTSLNYVVKTYNGEGQAVSVTNPYFTTADATYGTTLMQYDALGRKIMQTQPDGNVQEWCYDGVTSITSSSCNSLIGGTGTGTWVDFTDEIGNQWQRTSDALGRLTVVQEPNGATQNPSMETDYAYDVLNNLLTVNQHGNPAKDTVRTRSFIYDSISELKSSTNPESGTIQYAYDKVGNMIEKFDPRGSTITYSYDALNRVFAKNYSTGDPSVCMQYDRAATGGSDAYPIARLTLEWTAPTNTCPSTSATDTAIPSDAYNSTIVLSHDSMGRELAEKQCPYATSGACASNYQFNYTYDLAGGQTSFNNGIGTPMTAPTTVPPAMVFGVAYDTAEQIASVTITSQPGMTFPSIITQTDPTVTAFSSTRPYDAMGHQVYELTSLASSGASPGLKVTSTYDKRGRVTQEQALGQSTAITVPTGSFGVIGVGGSEQSAMPPATASVTFTGSEESPVLWYPCGNSSECQQITATDQGSVTLTINGHLATSGWGGSSTSTTVAQDLVSSINANSSTLGVNATLVGSTAWIFANSTSTPASSLPISLSVTDSYAGLSNDPFPSPSFSGSYTSFVGGNTTVYDSGSLTVSLTSTASDQTYGTTLATSSPVTWQSGSTGATLASAIVSALNSSMSSYITAALDDSGGSVDLKSAATGSGSDNYGVVVNVIDTTATKNPAYASFYLPSQSFDIESSSTTGAGPTETSYGPVYTYTVPPGGYTGNGNLLAHSDSVMGDWGFGYDTLNRLTGAAPADNAPSAYVGALGCWGYDGMGNRTLNAWVTATDCKSTTTPTSQYNTHNQVTLVSQTAPISYSAPSGFTYDAAGDVTVDGQNQYAYDGEGRICAVYNTISHTYTGYIYDAAGLRVAKGGVTSLSCNRSTNGFTLKSQYLLDQGSEQVTELDGLGNWVHSNVWAGAHLDATIDPKGMHYHLADPLGTRRIQTDTTGAVEASFQSLPFGDGFLATLTSLSTADDGTENHFTGKERDTESGNDYFGARYYASSMGRFLSPDWSAKVAPVPYAKLDDPQSLNLYAYVRNNPLSRADLDGHSDYLWQKTKNWVEGNGFKTDAQVKGLSVAQTAQSHNGSNDWAINTNNSSGKDVGHPQDFHSGQDKCNQFVGDTLAEAGKTRPEITDSNGNTRMPNAHELADPSVHIPGLSDTKPLSEAQPGDVIAQQHGDVYGHTGIVVGPGETASANATGSYGGQITVNSWGFRPAGQNGESGSDPAPVVRTPQ